VKSIGQREREDVENGQNEIEKGIAKKLRFSKPFVSLIFRAVMN